MAKSRSPGRSIRLLRAPAADVPGVLAFTWKKEEQFYAFREIPCDIGGRGWLLRRLDTGDTYHTRLGRPEDRSCECIGYLRHHTCKHLIGLSLLVERGEI